MRQRGPSGPKGADRAGRETQREKRNDSAVGPRGWATPRIASFWNGDTRKIADGRISGQGRTGPGRQLLRDSGSGPAIVLAIRPTARITTGRTRGRRAPVRRRDRVGEDRRGCTRAVYSRESRIETLLSLALASVECQVKILDTRSRSILKEIIRVHVDTGRPVSSRTLFKANRFALSPASIRNIMADLTDGGYLAQPHTRPAHPTNRAYAIHDDSCAAQGRRRRARAGRLRLDTAGGTSRSSFGGFASALPALGRGGLRGRPGRPAHRHQEPPFIAVARKDPRRPGSRADVVLSGCSRPPRRTRRPSSRRSASG